MLDLSIAIGHHLIIFALFGILAVELALLRDGITLDTVRRIGRIDIWYGILAGAILAIGFSRAIFAAKGWPYYSHNGFFWAKIATFATIALLSLPPTFRFIRWGRASAPPSSEDIRRAKVFLYTELVLFAPLLAFAAAMARGYGEMR